MDRFSLSQCCTLLAVDPKTLRQWLTQTHLALHPHPLDARIKCPTSEQVELLANLHDRVLSLPVEGLSAVPTDEKPEKRTGTALSDADLRTRLAQMEAQVATLQTQLTDLTLQLLREREQRTRERLLALEAEPVERVLTVASQVVLPSFAHHATGKRLIPLIEYGARGRYVLISPEDGELPITPDSPEWFEWVASLSSFRFVGQAGRLSARRGFNQRPNRSWYAQRTVHQQFRSKYIGASEHVTIARLE
ncbi:MAG TPA: hypothetical protein VGF67_04185 [Ktedonobacteraceae bacterium]|jgi:hypothetical protein